MADKRVERTKGYLREALEELLREKPLERITVTEVLARAEVSKNAFYTHYGSLTALVEDCYLHRLVYFCGTHKRRGDYATREEAITETMEQRARLLYDFKRNPNLARAVLTNVGASPLLRQLRGGRGGAERRPSRDRVRHGRTRRGLPRR